jgi:hypothetical protein
MRRRFSAFVAFLAMLAAEGTLAQAMVIVKEPPPPPPRGAGQASSQAPRTGMVWAPGYYTWHRGRFCGCRARGYSDPIQVQCGFRQGGAVITAATLLLRAAGVN